MAPLYAFLVLVGVMCVLIYCSLSSSAKVANLPRVRAEQTLGDRIKSAAWAICAAVLAAGIIAILKEDWVKAWIVHALLPLI